MNERRPGLRGEHLALLLVQAHVRVQPHGQQRHHQVQALVRAAEVEPPRGQALLGEALRDHQLLQLGLGVGGHAEGLLVQA